MSQYTQENCQEACRAKPATPYGTLKHSCGTCLNSIRRCLWDTHHGLWVPLSVPLSCWCSRFQSHLRKAQERSQVTSALGSGCSLGSRYSSKWLDVYKGGRQWAWGAEVLFSLKRRWCVERCLAPWLHYQSPLSQRDTCSRWQSKWILYALISF